MLVLASTELDDEVFDCSCVRKRVVEVEQAIIGSAQQNFWPLTLDSRGAGDEEPMGGQVLGKFITALGDLVIGEAA